MKDLKQLQSFSLSNSIIQDISFLKDLTQLQALSLRYNQIQDVSLFWLNSFPALHKLELKGNPIQNIPKEIFDKDDNVLIEVRTYLEDLERSKSENKEVKIIFIGNGSVGKTQIAKRLCEQDSFKFNTQHDSTHAIALLRRELAGFELNCWDFAGQDLYHATHRLFMQTRALLVLVWDSENENQDFHIWEKKEYENEKLLYWLEYAKCFAPESPLLVLQNKINTFPQDLYFEEKDKHRNEYPIVDFLKVSAETGKGFMLLEEKLEEIFRENKAFQTPPLPTNWVQVREKIRNLQANTNQKTLSFAEFESICKENECEKSAPTILGYLHNTGVLYYRKGYFNNEIILNQSWAIEAIYKILDRESRYFEVLEHQNGILYYKNLCKIWDKNTDEEKALFMDFMLSAELCFETTYNQLNITDRIFVVPQLFKSEFEQNTKNNIDTWKHENASKLQKGEKRYRFLPKVFIQRFIVKANRFSEVSLMWQKGLLLKTAEGSAIVEACYEKEQQKITILSESEFVIEKIEEELEKIAGEGKLQGKTGETEKLTEKFGLAGLNPAQDRNSTSSRSGISEQAKQHLIEDNLKQTLEMLLQQAEKQQDTDLENDCILQLSRLNGLEKQKNEGTISQADYDLGKARIRKATQELIRKTPHPTQP